MVVMAKPKMRINLMDDKIDNENNKLIKKE